MGSYGGKRLSFTGGIKTGSVGMDWILPQFLKWSGKGLRAMETAPRGCSVVEMGLVKTCVNLCHINSSGSL